MNADQTRRDFTLSWTLDAPRAQVFQAWTDPDHLGWYYNDHQPIPNEPIEVDLRVGESWRQRMVIDESTNFVTGGIYREIVEDEKIVFTWGATAMAEARSRAPRRGPARHRHAATGLGKEPEMTVDVRSLPAQPLRSRGARVALTGDFRTAGATPWIG